MSTDCPSDNELAAYVEGGGGQTAIEAHVADCAACRAAAARLTSLGFESTAAASPMLLARSRDASPLALDDTALATPDGAAEAPASAGAPPTFSAGTFVGRHRIVRRVGAGAMGSVYLAYDPELDRRVALKLLRRELGEGAVGRELRDRLVREAKAMARLNHPNVVTVYDVGQTDGQVFIAMEYVEGTTLRTWLAREARPFRDVLAAFRDAGRGLAAAHAAGLVHRDFKPDNVLVSNDGRIRVTDFGLASLGAAPLSIRGTEEVSGDALVTRTGALVGTPAYIAPELYAGGTADVRADVFSFGVALYEGLYRQRPYDGDSVLDLLKNVRAGQLRPLPANAPKIPAAIREATLRAIARDPAERTPTLGALLEAITPEPRRAGIRLAGAATGLAAAVVAGSILFASRRAPALVLPNGARPAVAVLGFDARTRKDVGWVGAELDEAIRRELGVGGKLRLVELPAASAPTPSPSAIDKAVLETLRTRTGADYAIAESFEPGRDQASDDLELEVHVYRADLGREVKTFRIDGRALGLVDVADRAAERVRLEVGVPAASAEDRAAAAKALPTKPDAAEAFGRGTERLEARDPLGARPFLERAVATEPGVPMPHLALAAALDDLGIVDRARDETKQAFDLAGALTREERLSIEGLYRERAHEWPKAIELDRALFTFFPDNLEYGLRLANAETSARALDDAARTFDALRALPKPLSDDARIDLGEARLKNFANEYPAALVAANAALVKAEAQGWDLLRARATHTLATIQDAAGNPAETTALAERAQALYSRVGALGGLEDVGGILAHQALKKRDFAEAKRRLLAVIEIATKTGDEVRLTQQFLNLGIVLRQANSLAEARQAYETAREHLGRSGRDRGTEGTLANNLASLCMEEGDLDTARVNATRALELRREARDQMGAATTLSNLAVVAMEKDELDDARKFVEEALAIARGMKATQKIATILLTAGSIAMYQGRAEAEALLDECASTSHEAGLPDYEALALAYLSTMAVKRHDLPGAKALAERADKAVAGPDGTVDDNDVVVWTSSARAATDTGAQSVAYLEKSLEQVKKDGHIDARVFTQLALARLEKDPKKRAEAFAAARAFALEHGYKLAARFWTP